MSVSDSLNQAMERGYALLVFQENYGRDWIALIAPDADQAAFIENQLTCGDIAAVEMQCYMASAGRYFPVSRNRQMTPTAALADLQAVLDSIPSDRWPAWHDDVLAAFDTLRAAAHTYQESDYWIAKARDAGELVLVD